ncbi:HypC/HybG/HupF family hydrogenase formation chaperone [Neptunomonas concharum]|uniref:HypC/HybG/HupF family hydrogenase formation chaperone n=1 Tax=Neptunomonas concharum TaxID=1031538 RepID=A0A5P1RBZ6_9GAMM|nr:HypC/HybG/HupF family hydrogenase formation chaperone [Neptunomonas concharum]QEQ97184.1 HypC/HybG/HupF family hydrogenase formation chaperone [Neptunomonas concharum]
MCLGIPGRIIEITDADNALGLVDVSGVKREVNLGCVLPEGDLTALIGRWALVHVGFAMSLIDEEEAHKTLDLLRELGEFAEELDALQLNDGLQR